MNVNDLSARFKGRGPVVLIVLDGWGVGDHTEGDAVYQARTPTLDDVSQRFASTTLLTHGRYVGLPNEKDIGGSEVGHMTMGAGRIIAQGPTRIKQMMESGEFFHTEVMDQLIRNCRQNDAALHLIGLLSDGNVHSHIDHYYRILDHAIREGVRRVYVHALLDGRDVPYQSALDYVEPLEARLAEVTGAHAGWDYAIASGGGREILTMDRDLNWDKVRLGWEVHVHGNCENRVPSASAAITESRRQHPDRVDQDLPPFVVTRDGKPVGPMADGDSVIFMNFRGDRAIEFSQAMLQDDFQGFERGVHPRVVYAGMSKYDEDTDLPPRTLISPPSVEQPFGRRILDLGLNQFRLAETQKYAHVTFFFNGGYREPLDPGKELYELIPSDKIPSFAAAPHMKAAEVGARGRELILSGSCRFGLINFANADMVGHTGNLAAAVKGVEAVDRALRPILDAVTQVDGLALITADHGNAEEMISFNPKTQRREINTRHSINPVPVYLYDPRYNGPEAYRLRPSDPAQPNTLANIAATLFILLGLPVPADIERPLFDLS